MELDKALEKMGEALTALNDEKAAGKRSRELSIAVTELETAILWRRQDLRIKDPVGGAEAGGDEECRTEAGAAHPYN